MPPADCSLAASSTHASSLASTRLDPEAEVPLYRQIVEALRADILVGRLTGGRRLESSRQLGRQLGVSRNTVLQAYDQLTAEGYLEGRRGSGTYVSRDLPARPLAPARSSSADSDRGRAASVGCRQAPISAMGRRFVELAADQRETLLRPFQSGVAALDALPLALWRRTATRAFAELSLDELGYGDPRGLPRLRQALTEYLWAARGIECDADQVFLVEGSQQALDMSARVLLDPGDPAWVEDPGYPGTRAALAAAGAHLVPVPLDGDGLIVEHGVSASPEARLACVTPSHQYPLGTVMGVARRLELLDWAQGADAWVVEDDYDSEFRYSGRPLPALKSLDRSDRVLYIGTFSKVLYPALRLGYLVVPRSLIRAFLGARFCAGRQAPVADQVSVHRFLWEGHLARHLRRMRALYQRRQSWLLEAVRDSGCPLEVSPSEAGMHLVGWLAHDRDDRIVAERATAAGLRVEPLQRYRLAHRVRPGLLLGYTAFDRAQIRSGIETLRTVLEQV